MKIKRDNDELSRFIGNEDDYKYSDSSANQGVVRGLSRGMSTKTFMQLQFNTGGKQSLFDKSDIRRELDASSISASFPSPPTNYGQEVNQASQMADSPAGPNWHTSAQKRLLDKAKQHGQTLVPDTGSRGVPKFATSSDKRMKELFDTLQGGAKGRENVDIKFAKDAGGIDIVRVNETKYFGSSREVVTSDFRMTAGGLVTVGSGGQAHGGFSLTGWDSDQYQSGRILSTETDKKGNSLRGKRQKTSGMIKQAIKSGVGINKWLQENVRPTYVSNEQLAMPMLHSQHIASTYILGNRPVDQNGEIAPIYSDEIVDVLEQQNRISQRKRPNLGPNQNFNRNNVNRILDEPFVQKYGSGVGLTEEIKRQRASIFGAVGTTVGTHAVPGIGHKPVESNAQLSGAPTRLQGRKMKTLFVDRMPSLPEGTAYARSSSMGYLSTGTSRIEVDKSNLDTWKSLYKEGDVFTQRGHRINNFQGTNKEYESYLNDLYQNTGSQFAGDLNKRFKESDADSFYKLDMGNNRAMRINGYETDSDGRTFISYSKYITTAEGSMKDSGKNLLQGMGDEYFDNIGVKQPIDAVAIMPGGGHMPNVALNAMSNSYESREAFAQDMTRRAQAIDPNLRQEHLFDENNAFTPQGSTIGAHVAKQWWLNDAEKQVVPFKNQTLDQEGYEREIKMATRLGRQRVQGRGEDPSKLSQEQLFDEGNWFELNGERHQTTSLRPGQKPVQQGNFSVYKYDYNAVGVVADMVTNVRSEHASQTTDFSAEELERIRQVNPTAYKSMMRKAQKMGNRASDFIRTVYSNVMPEAELPKGTLRAGELDEFMKYVDQTKSQIFSEAESAGETLSTASVKRRLINRLADSEYGDRPIMLGDGDIGDKGTYVLPSMRHAREHLADINEHRLQNNYALYGINALEAQSQLRERESAFATGGATEQELDIARRKRDAVAYSAFESSLDLANNPSIVGKALGVNANVAGGPARALIGLQPNQVAITSGHYRRMMAETGEYSDDELNTMVDEFKSGTRTGKMAVTMYPHSSPDKAYHNAQVVSTESMQASGLFPDFTPIENQLYLAPALAEAHAKDFDADYVKGFMMDDEAKFDNALEAQNILEQIESDAGLEKIKQDERFLDDFASRANKIRQDEKGVYNRWTQAKSGGDKRKFMDWYNQEVVGDTLWKGSRKEAEYLKKGSGMNYNPFVRETFGFMYGSMKQANTTPEIEDRLIKSGGRMAQIAYQPALDIKAVDKATQFLQDVRSTGVWNRNDRPGANSSAMPESNALRPSKGGKFTPIIIGDTPTESARNVYQNLMRWGSYAEDDVNANVYKNWGSMSADQRAELKLKDGGKYQQAWLFAEHGSKQLAGGLVPIATQEANPQSVEQMQQFILDNVAGKADFLADKEAQRRFAGIMNNQEPAELTDEAVDAVIRDTFTGNVTKGHVDDDGNLTEKGYRELSPIGSAFAGFMSANQTRNEKLNNDTPGASGAIGRDMTAQRVLAKEMREAGDLRASLVAGSKMVSQVPEAFGHIQTAMPATLGTNIGNMSPENIPSVEEITDKMMPDSMRDINRIIGSNVGKKNTFHATAGALGERQQIRLNPNMPISKDGKMPKATDQKPISWSHAVSPNDIGPALSRNLSEEELLATYATHVVAPHPDDASRTLKELRDDGKQGIGPGAYAPYGYNPKRGINSDYVQGAMKAGNRFEAGLFNRLQNQNTEIAKRGLQSEALKNQMYDVDLLVDSGGMRTRGKADLFLPTEEGTAYLADAKARRQLTKSMINSPDQSVREKAEKMVVQQSANHAGQLYMYHEASAKNGVDIGNQNYSVEQSPAIITGSGADADAPTVSEIGEFTSQIWDQDEAPSWYGSMQAQTGMSWDNYRQFQQSETARFQERTGHTDISPVFMTQKQLDIARQNNATIAKHRENINKLEGHNRRGRPGERTNVQLKGQIQGAVDQMMQGKSGHFNMPGFNAPIGGTNLADVAQFPTGNSAPSTPIGNTVFGGGGDGQGPPDNTPSGVVPDSGDGGGGNNGGGGNKGGGGGGFRGGPITNPFYQEDEILSAVDELAEMRDRMRDASAMLPGSGSTDVLTPEQLKLVKNLRTDRKRMMTIRKRIADSSDDMQALAKNQAVEEGIIGANETINTGIYRASTGGWSEFELNEDGSIKTDDKNNKIIETRKDSQLSNREMSQKIRQAEQMQRARNMRPGFNDPRMRNAQLSTSSFMGEAFSPTQEGSSELRIDSVAGTVNKLTEALNEFEKSGKRAERTLIDTAKAQVEFTDGIKGHQENLREIGDTIESRGYKDLSPAQLAALDKTGRSMHKAGLITDEQAQGLQRRERKAGVEVANQAIAKLQLASTDGDRTASLLAEMGEDGSGARSKWAEYSIDYMRGMGRTSRMRKLNQIKADGAMMDVFGTEDEQQIMGQLYRGDVMQRLMSPMTIWGASAFKGMFVQPLQQNMELYEQRQAQRATQSMYSGITSSETMLNSEFGTLQRRTTARDAGAEALGGQFLRAYGGMQDIMFSKSMGEGAPGVASAIGLPSVFAGALSQYVLTGGRMDQTMTGIAGSLLGVGGSPAGGIGPKMPMGRQLGNFARNLPGNMLRGAGNLLNSPLGFIGGATALYGLGNYMDNAGQDMGAMMTAGVRLNEMGGANFGNNLRNLWENPTGMLGSIGTNINTRWRSFTQTDDESTWRHHYRSSAMGYIGERLQRGDNYSDILSSNIEVDADDRTRRLRESGINPLVIEEGTTLDSAANRWMIAGEIDGTPDPNSYSRGMQKVEAVNALAGFANFAQNELGSTPTTDEEWQGALNSYKTNIGEHGSNTLTESSEQTLDFSGVRFAQMWQRYQAFNTADTQQLSELFTKEELNMLNVSQRAKEMVGEYNFLGEDALGQVSSSLYNLERWNTNTDQLLPQELQDTMLALEHRNFVSNPLDRFRQVYNAQSDKNAIYNKDDFVGFMSQLGPSLNALLEDPGQYGLSPADVEDRLSDENIGFASDYNSLLRRGGIATTLNPLEAVFQTDGGIFSSGRGRENAMSFAQTQLAYETQFRDNTIRGGINGGVSNIFQDIANDISTGNSTLFGIDRSDTIGFERFLSNVGAMGATLETSPMPMFRGLDTTHYAQSYADLSTGQLTTTNDLNRDQRELFNMALPSSGYGFSNPTQTSTNLADAFTSYGLDLNAIGQAIGQETGRTDSSPASQQANLGEAFGSLASSIFGGVGVGSLLHTLEKGGALTGQEIEDIQTAFDPQTMSRRAGVNRQLEASGADQFMDKLSFDKVEVNELLINDKSFEVFGQAVEQLAQASMNSPQMGGIVGGLLNPILSGTQGSLIAGAPQFMQGMSNLGQAYGTMSRLSQYGNTDGASILGGTAMQMNGGQFDLFMRQSQGDLMALSQNPQMATAMFGEGISPLLINQTSGLQQAEMGISRSEYGMMQRDNFQPGAFAMNYSELQGEMGAYGGVVSTRTIQARTHDLQMGLAGYQAAMGNYMRNVGLEMQTGGGTVGDDGFMVGGDGLEGMQAMYAKQGFDLNVGNGMGMWQIQDRQTQISREKQDFQMGMQERSLGIQDDQRELQKRQFYERWDFNKERFEYNTSHQQWQMDFGREQQLTQRGWAETDMAVNQQTASLNFAWQMDDSDRNLRYARGKERVDLMRNRGRQATMFGIQQAQRNREESRFEQKTSWEDEEYDKKVEHFQQTKEFQIEQMEMEKRHFEERMALTEEQAEMQREQFEMQKAHIEELRQLEDQSRLLQRQQSIFQVEMQNRISSAVAGTQKKISELNKVLQDIGVYMNDQIERMKLAVETGGNFQEKLFGVLDVLGINTEKMREMVDTTTIVQQQMGIAVDHAKNIALELANMKVGKAYGDETANIPEHFVGGMAGNFVAETLGRVQGGMQSFASGGYTGMGTKYQPAGIVHAGEYVIPQEGSPVVRGDNPQTIELLTKIADGIEALVVKPEKSSTINVTTNTSDNLTIDDIVKQANRRIQ